MTDGRVRGTGPAPADRAGEWEHFAHGADIGVRGRGATPSQAFEQAALALTAVVTDPTQVRTTTATEVHCRAPDLDLLLYEWLNSLVFHMSTERLLFAGFDVRISGGELFAQARGEPVDVVRHSPAVEVKGATLTELGVRREDDGRWCAQCVIDV